MKIPYEMQTSLGKARRSFSLSTTPMAKASRFYCAALAVAIIVFALLIANAAGILAQVIQVVNLLSTQVIAP